MDEHYDFPVDSHMERMNIEQAEKSRSTMAQDEQKTASALQEQLDLSKELIRIENLLKGKVLQVTEDGEEWVDGPEQLRLLSDFGVQWCMWLINFYLNKNTLLSNYDEETIFKKLEDFSITLADYLFMNYELCFVQPSEDEVEAILNEKIDKRVRNAKLDAELRGIKFTQEDADAVKQNWINETDTQRERIVIAEQWKKNKYKSFESIVRVIQDSVHSTYLRALAGAERRTLRQSIHVSETLNPYGGRMGMGPDVPQKKGFFRR